VDSGSSDSFIDSVLIQTQHLPAYRILPIKLRLIWWNSEFCHLAGSGPANPFSYWGIPEPDFLCHSFGPELYNCTRIPLAHLLQSLDDWVLGSIFFRQLSQHESKSSPSVKTLLSSAPFPNPPDSVLEPLEPLPPVTPWEQPRVTLINAAAYSCTSKLEGSDFSNSASHFLRSLVIPQPLPRQRPTWVLFLKITMTLRMYSVNPRLAS